MAKVKTHKPSVENPKKQLDEFNNASLNDILNSTTSNELDSKDNKENSRPGLFQRRSTVANLKQHDKQDARLLKRSSLYSGALRVALPLPQQQNSNEMKYIPRNLGQAVRTPIAAKSNNLPLTPSRRLTTQNIARQLGKVLMETSEASPMKRNALVDDSTDSLLKTPRKPRVPLPNPFEVCKLDKIKDELEALTSMEQELLREIEHELE